MTNCKKHGEKIKVNNRWRCYKCEREYQRKRRKNIEEKKKDNEKNKKYRKTKRGRYIVFLNRVKRRNDKNKSFCNLTENQHDMLINMKCFYCNKYHKNKNYCGIDRIDNNKGYTLENCVPCCQDCNSMKEDKNFFEFIKKCNEIVNNFNKNYNIKNISKLFD